MSKISRLSSPSLIADNSWVRASSVRMVSMIWEGWEICRSHNIKHTWKESIAVSSCSRNNNNLSLTSPRLRIRWNSGADLSSSRSFCMLRKVLGNFQHMGFMAKIWTYPRRVATFFSRLAKVAGSAFISSVVIAAVIIMTRSTKSWHCSFIILTS